MHQSLYLFGVLACAAVSLLAQDPVKVDAKHYKVEFENANVRVLRVSYAPGEKSIMHNHPEAVAVFLTDSKGKFTYPGGKSEEWVSKPGETRTTPAVKHLPENTGSARLELILVEVKKK